MSRPSHNTRSFLRWAGSKKKLVPILRTYWDKNESNRYIEPFVGSAQLYFAIETEEAVLSDQNKDLINCYRAVQTAPDIVFDYLTEFPTGPDNYYKIRAYDENQWPMEKSAARFIYLNTYCFNGLYRTNNSGNFNVPYSKSSANPLTKERILEISKNIQQVTFCCADFQETVGAFCRPKDFIYLDPPYAVKNKQIFTQYGPHTFGISDLERVDKTLELIHGRDATFLLSYAYCEEIMEIAKKWNFTTVQTVRNISGFAKHRKQELEVLITNITNL